MKESLSISKEIEKNLRTEKKDYQKKISFSQYSVYESCPYRWYLTYVKNNYLFSSSIHAVFGTAIHETIQEYLRVFYGESAKAADSIDLDSFFEKAFRKEYKKEVENNEGKHFSNEKEMFEFYNDGISILKEFKKRRSAYFSNRDQELLGVEIPILVEIKDDNDVFLFYGFVDIAIRDKKEGLVYIDDVKTSTKGWLKSEKSDPIKTAQVLLYKKFFSKQYGIDEGYVVPRFRILKRKLWEGVEFKQSRIQMHEPANGAKKVQEAVQRLLVFIEDCFNKDGTPKEKTYVKKPSPSNCKFCPFNNRPDLCNKKNIT